MSKRDRPLACIFAAPLLLAALSLVGLVGALLADGWWDPFGALLLAACLAPVAMVFTRRRVAGRKADRLAAAPSTA